MARGDRQSHLRRCRPRPSRPQRPARRACRRVLATQAPPKISRVQGRTVRAVGITLVLEDKLGQRCALPTYPQRSSNQKDQINRTIDESRLSANNPIASGTSPGGDIMSEAGARLSRYAGATSSESAFWSMHVEAITSVA